jgi:hypothetical protein
MRAKVRASDLLRLCPKRESLGDRDASGRREPFGDNVVSDAGVGLNR